MTQIGGVVYMNYKKLFFSAFGWEMQAISISIRLFYLITAESFSLSSSSLISLIIYSFLFISFIPSSMAHGMVS